MEENKFTWIPFFEELLKKICNNYNAESLYVLWNKFFPEQYDSVDGDGETSMIKMDPISFIGKITSLGNENLSKNCKELKDILTLQSNVPLDFDGIPRMNRTNPVFFNEYWQNRTGKEDFDYLDYVMDTLWQFAKDLNSKSIKSTDLKIDKMDEVVRFHKVAINKLSQIIYLVKPQIYYSCDDKSLSYLNLGITDNKDINEYFELQDIMKKTLKTPYELSDIAQIYSLKRDKFHKYIKTIAEQNPSYQNFINSQIYNEKMERIIYQLTSKHLYDIETESSLNELIILLKKYQEWNNYNEKNQNGIPHAILNTHYRKYILNVDDTEKNYWWLNANPTQWSVYNLKNGEEGFYTYYNETGNKRRVFENFQNAKEGDLVIGYETHPTKKVMSLLEISKNKDEKIYFKKIKNFDKQITLDEINREPELSKMECLNGQGSLFKLTQQEYKKIIEMTQNIQSKGKRTMPKQPLNQILYGPPGTGKTYNTVIKAMEIIDEKQYTDNKGNLLEGYDYHDLKEQFDAYKEQGQIEFVTFHQSYSYEEFVEGIKPVTDEDDWTNPTDKLLYAGNEGIFKRICKKAEDSYVQDTNNSYCLNKNPKIWKVSLKSTGDNDIRTDCMTNNRIRIGFDKYGKFISDETIFDETGKRVVPAFINKMEVGDLVLSCYTEKTIDAIGVITSEYKWNNDFAEYKRYRDVKWLIKGLNHNIVNINKGKKFTLSTIYQLNNMAIKDVLDIVNKHQNQKEYKGKYKPHVLIIDEINRGNISKIFGELITLIEPDKRKNVTGDDREYHTLEVTLPYSKDPFYVPNNLYIIGTMNTSDRSIASVDIALRRRFKFVEMMPKAELFENVTIKEFDGKTLKDLLETLNQRISILLDRDHQIGHSYFIQFQNKTEISVNDLKNIWFDEIMPLLNEYFYSDWDKLQDLLGVANDDSCSFVKEYKTENILCGNKSCAESSYFDFRLRKEYDNNSNFEKALNYFLQGKAS